MKTEGIMRAGVIDIGSSSTKLIIGEVEDNEIKILEFLKHHIPIGRHTFYKGKIPQESINQIITTLVNFKEVLSQYEAAKVVVIATTAVREARNKDIFIDAVARKTGLNIEILTVGDVVYYFDAYLSHKLKKKYPLHERNVLIAELGAGSLDVSLMEKGFTLVNIGLPIGTLRLRQLMSKLDASTEENYEAAREYIENEFSYLKRTLPLLEIDDVILIDESYSQHLPNIVPELTAGQIFYPLRKEQADTLTQQLADKTAEEVSQAYRIPPETADTFADYAIIANQFFQLIRSDHIYLLETSLAEAILANVLVGFELAKKYDKTNQLISVAIYLCHKYEVDFDHAACVAGLCDTLFNRLWTHLGLKREDSLYLLLAAYLHDIGSFIYNRAHHKHSEYIISCQSLFRLTDEEIKVIACIGRYHRKAVPAPGHPLYSSLPGERQLLVQKLSALLRIANALDCSHRQKIDKLEVTISQDKSVKFLVHTKKNFVLEKAEFLDKKDLLEQVSGSLVSLTIKQ